MGANKVLWRTPKVASSKTVPFVCGQLLATVTSASGLWPAGRPALHKEEEADPAAPNWSIKVLGRLVVQTITSRKRAHGRRILH